MAITAPIPDSVNSLGWLWPCLVAFTGAPSNYLLASPSDVALSGQSASSGKLMVSKGGSETDASSASVASSTQWPLRNTNPSSVLASGSTNQRCETPPGRRSPVSRSDRFDGLRARALRTPSRVRWCNRLHREIRASSRDASLRGLARQCRHPDAIPVRPRSTSRRARAQTAQPVHLPEPNSPKRAAWPVPAGHEACPPALRPPCGAARQARPDGSPCDATCPLGSPGHSCLAAGFGVRCERGNNDFVAGRVLEEVLLALELREDLIADMQDADWISATSLPCHAESFGSPRLQWLPGSQCSRARRSCRCRS